MYGVSRQRTEVIKAREVELTFRVDETNPQEIDHVRSLHKQGAQGFKGQRLDLKITDYITVHNVLAIESIETLSALDRKQAYLHGSSPTAAYVKIKFIVDPIKNVQAMDENLIEAPARPAIAVSSTQMKTLKNEQSNERDES